MYNIEIARYVIATGEVPIVGFARVPPGRRVWIPLSLFAIFSALVLGGWAKGAAKGLFAVMEGNPPGADDAGQVKLLTFVLLAAVLVFTLAFRRITRGLELVNGLFVAFQVGFLLIVAVAVVPWDVWWEGIRGFLVPDRPPKGVSASTLGGLVGFSALAAGLNWFFLNHYHDKGYGVGGQKPAAHPGPTRHPSSTAHQNIPMAPGRKAIGEVRDSRSSRTTWPRQELVDLSTHQEAGERPAREEAPTEKEGSFNKQEINDLVWGRVYITMRGKKRKPTKKGAKTPDHRNGGREEGHSDRGRHHRLRSGKLFY